MRFPKETRALIHEAAPHPARIPWPAGSEPTTGRLYWVQSAEDLEAERKRREDSPDTCAEVLAGMRRRLNPNEPVSTPKRRRRNPRAPLAGSERIRVIDAEIKEVGWEALVEVYEEPDPVRHLRVKAKVPAGPNPIEGYQEPTEIEPEQLPPIRRRLEEEEALRIAHAASIDHASVIKAEQKLLDQRRRGRRSKLAEEAVQRAKKRAA
jgi:hypothetical protein